MDRRVFPTRPSVADVWREGCRAKSGFAHAPELAFLLPVLEQADATRRCAVFGQALLELLCTRSGVRSRVAAELDEHPRVAVRKLRQGVRMQMHFLLVAEQLVVDRLASEGLVF